MLNFILRNPGKSLWVLMCVLAIDYLDESPDLQVILSGWAVCPTVVLYECEMRNISHKWRWAVANFLLPWIAIWVFILLNGGKLKRQSQARKLQRSVRLKRRRVRKTWYEFSRLNSGQNRIVKWHFCLKILIGYSKLTDFCWNAIVYLWCTLDWHNE